MSRSRAAVLSRKILAGSVAVGVVAASSLTLMQTATAAAGVAVTVRPNSAVPAPSLQPVPGKPLLDLASFPVKTLGFSEKEFFLSGTATSVKAVGKLTPDGKWNVAPDREAAYKTRLVIAAPTDPSRFHGRIIVEWLNVTAGQDAAVAWSFAHDEMARSGDIYVGVSAQKVGINYLVKSDPQRYGSLSSPGDQFSYGIFSQAGAAVRSQLSKVLPGYRATTMFAYGESQSAGLMTTYVDAFAVRDHVYDGYLIHSRGPGASALSPSLFTQALPVVQIRTDLKVPVLTLQSETDMLGLGNFVPAAQPDGQYFRLWEMAGTAHADAYESLLSTNDKGGLASDRSLFNDLSAPPTSISAVGINITCATGFNSGDEHYVTQTAFRDLFGWIKTGQPPRSMPRLGIDSSVTPPAFRVDAVGNVLGGIRTPAVDVPLARLSGLPAPGGTLLCLFFGQTIPFTANQIFALYPSHADFVMQWRKAVTRDEQLGYLLPEDAKHLSQAVS